MGAAGGVAAAGGVFSALAQLQQAQAAKAIARFNADVQGRQATQEALLLERDARALAQERLQEKDVNDFNVSQRRRLFQRVSARRRAFVGASGVEFSGSQLLVAADEAREMELDIAALEFGSQRAQAELQEAQDLALFQAAEVRAGGDFAGEIAGFQRRRIDRELPLQLTASLLGSSSGVIGGLSQPQGLNTRQSLGGRSLASRRSFSTGGQFF